MSSKRGNSAPSSDLRRTTPRLPRRPGEAGLRSAPHRLRACRVLCVAGAIREDAMIHHLSIAARDPKHAAGVLAELMGGTAVQFPPNPGSFFALQLDDHESGVEDYPSGTELEPNGEVGGSF